MMMPGSFHGTRASGVASEDRDRLQHASARCRSRPGRAACRRSGCPSPAPAMISAAKPCGMLQPAVDRSPAIPPQLSQPIGSHGSLPSLSDDGRARPLAVRAQPRQAPAARKRTCSAPGSEPTSCRRMRRLMAACGIATAKMAAGERPLRLIGCGYLARFRHDTSSGGPASESRGASNVEGRVVVAAVGPRDRIQVPVEHHRA